MRSLQPLLPARRRALTAAAVVVLAATSLASSAAANSSSPTAPTVRTSGSACDVTAHGSAGAALRIRPGADAVEPNVLSDRAVAAMERQFQARAAAVRMQQRRHALPSTQAQPSVTTVDVHVHVLLDRRGRGGVSAAAVRAQMAKTNRSFGGGDTAKAAHTSFRFRLASLNRVRNTAWHRMGYDSPAERQAKRALHTGSAEDLNLYVADIGAQGLLGWATFPSNYAHKRWADGVVINKNSVPGGSEQGYNEGDTATHEIGHWLGLFHTFQGGCADRDMVRDTPAEQYPAYGCPEDSDSCPGRVGLDPVDNFMDYSSDACLTRFTHGQSTRMNAQWLAFRSGQ